MNSLLEDVGREFALLFLPADFLEMLDDNDYTNFGQEDFSDDEIKDKKRVARNVDAVLNKGYESPDSPACDDLYERIGS